MTEEVREQIMDIRDSGLTNMLDVNTVQRLAYERDFYDQTYAITPLEGAFGPILAEGDVELESENVKPFTYSKLIGLRNSYLGQYLTCYIYCDWDDISDWDNLSDEEKMGALNAQALIYKVIPMQSQSTYLIIHAGEGEDIKYSCAISE